MPDSTAEWLWFLFFSVGAIGGILSLVDRLLNVIDMLRERRHIGVVIKSRLDK